MGVLVALVAEGGVLVPQERRLPDQVGHGAPVALRSDLEADLLGRPLVGSALAPSCPWAWLAFMALSSLSPSLLARDRIVVLPSLAVSFCPSRDGGPARPRPDKPLRGRLWPGAGGHASPDLRISLPSPTRGRRAGVSAPGRGTGHPPPKRRPYERPTTL